MTRYNVVNVITAADVAVNVPIADFVRNNANLSFATLAGITPQSMGVLARLTAT